MKLDFTNTSYKESALNTTSINYENSITSADAFLVLLNGIEYDGHIYDVEELMDNDEDAKCEFDYRDKKDSPLYCNFTCSEKLKEDGRRRKDHSQEGQGK